jgi:hypothetical protein
MDCKAKAGLMFNKTILIVSILTELAFSQTKGVSNNIYLGLKPIIPQEAQVLQQNKVNFINLNKIGLKRVNGHLREIGRPDLPEEVLKDPEFDNSPKSALANVYQSISSLPSHIDNSSDPNIKNFPAIGNQGYENSCVAWTTTYYMMSNEVCLVTPGCDNQSVGSSTSRIFSPRWTYNLINRGIDKGSFFSFAFSLIKNHGAATLAQLPYQAGDYLKWDLKSQDWRSAIWFRMKDVQSFVINTDNQMQLVKQALINGHVMLLGTYINSWVVKTVSLNSSVPTNPYTGQQIVIYQNGTVGSHAMTIVGYDDTIWTDINGDNIVESSELGAFKIANSWGKNYGNNGFIWAAYDAFRKVSLVSNFTPTNRGELAQSGSVYQTTYAAYSPKLLVRTKLSHLKRMQISMKFGLSSNYSANPTSFLMLSALQNAGGNFAFDGSLTEVLGIFYFDISVLLNTNWNKQRYYFISTDSTAENPLTVANFEVLDPLTDKVLYASTGVPSYVDANSQTYSAGDLLVDTQPPTPPGNLTARKGTSSILRTSLSWQVSTDNGQLKYYRIYRNNVHLKTVSDNVLTYADTYNLVRGITYVYVIKAVDASSNVSMPSNSVTVKF